jgi:hypothetical protein
MKKILVMLSLIFMANPLFAGYKVAIASGNFSTNSTWGNVPNVPTLHATTNITVTNTNNYTATFTALNTTSSVLGCVVYCAAVGTTDWVLTLQENSVDTVATSTLTVANRYVGWNYIIFPTSYTYTSTAVGYYRFKLRTSGASSGTGTVAADSGGTLISFLTVSNNTGTPQSTDNIFLVSNYLNPITVTIDGTQTIGAATNTTTIPTIRELTDAVIISTGCTLKFDTTASATFYVQGNILIDSGGELQAGTTYSYYPSTCTAIISFMQHTTANYGINQFNGGRLILEGQPNWTSQMFSTSLSTGIGTTASPLITVSTVGWNVGDQILVCPSTNYLCWDERYIKTVVNTTTYILCSVPGGAESGFTFTHSTGALVLNATRNIIITSTNPATLASYIYNTNTIAGNLITEWCRFENFGENATNKQGFVLNVAAVQATINNSVFYGGYNTFKIDMGNALNILTFNGDISYKTRYAHIWGVNNNTGVVFNNCYFLNAFTGSYVTYTSICTNWVFNNCYWIGNGVDVASYLNTTCSIKYYGCEWQCNKSVANFYNVGNNGIIFNSCKFGTQGVNGQVSSYAADIAWYANFLDVVYSDCLFGTPVTVYNNGVGMPTGASISFQNFNNVQNDNRWYDANGIYQSCGAGLTDTNVHKTGNMTLRMYPKTSTGLSLSLKVVAISSEAVQCFGFLQENTAFATSASTLTVQMFLPSNLTTTPDAQQVMVATTTWQVFSLAVPYTGASTLFATVKIIAQSTTSNAYVYVADIYNGTNALTGMNIWDVGKIAPVMYPTLGDPLSLWNVVDSAAVVSGTKGSVVHDTLIKADDAGILGR